MDTLNERETFAPAPIGNIGTASVCKCGAGPHPSDSQRCARGHALSANTLPVVTGSRSLAFWRAAEALRSEIRETAIEDARLTSQTASKALQLTADGLAQVALIRDSAYLRILEEGGPFSSAGRVRRAHAVWESALAGVERHVKLLGLDRRQKAIPSLEQYLAARKPDEAGS
jgi:hypothetical protein